MSDECPFCGAEAVKRVEWLDGHSYDFSCGSEQTPRGFVRTDDCYKAELACKDELLQKAVKLFNAWLYLEKRGLLSCAFSPKILARETNVFITIPEVVKMVEEKP